jgi:hypothetical protein
VSLASRAIAATSQCVTAYSAKIASMNIASTITPASPGTLGCEALMAREENARREWPRISPYWRLFTLIFRLWLVKCAIFARSR